MTGLRIAPGLSLPEDTVTQALGILAKRGAGKSNTGAVLAEEMHKAGLQFVVVDPVGAWWGLRSSADGKTDGLPVPILGGYRGDLPLEAGGGKDVAEFTVGERVSCVIDVSAFSESEKKRFLADFAERLFRQKGMPGHEEPLHLFLEEADDYAPQGGTRGGDVGRCLGAFQRIVKQGRARGLGSTMITQRSAALNKDLLTQIDTLIVLRTTSPQDRKAIEGWVTYHDVDGEILASLSELENGEAWVWSPEALDLVKRVSIRRRSTFDSGATPKAGGQRRAPKTMADVDLSGLEAQMKETIDRAKKTDPRELQKRVRELEVELAKRSEVAQEVVIEVPVEVSVMADEDRRLLVQVEERVGKLIARVNDVRDVGTGMVPGENPGRPRSGHETPVPAPRPREEGLPRRGSSSPDVTPSEQKILDALAWLRGARLYPAPRSRLGWVAGYKPKGGRFNNLLGAMRSAGLIDYSGAGMVELTEAGFVQAEPPPRVLTFKDMHAMVLDKLPRSEGTVLSVLLHVYPGAIDRYQLADRSNYDPKGGRFSNIVGTLSGLGLVEYPERGMVRAAPVLFLED